MILNELSNLSVLLLTYLFNETFAILTVSSSPKSPRPPSFRGKYNLSTLLFGCKALCIVISFLVCLSSCSISNFVQSRNAAEYLSSDIAQVLIPFMRFPALLFHNFIFHFMVFYLICLKHSQIFVAFSILY